jgi:hypothetical protein
VLCWRRNPDAAAAPSVGAAGAVPEITHWVRWQISLISFFTFHIFVAEWLPAEKKQ